jgi:orotidine-5'-phosphate decarboxylase
MKVGRVQAASYSSVILKTVGGTKCALKIQKDLFSAFGTLILERLATAGAFLS